MAVREFTDARGIGWKAWNITPESIHPQTRIEDYLVDRYQDGWLVFATASGDEKRRLCPYPATWDECTESELQAMLAHAEIVPPIKGSAPLLIADEPDDAPFGAARSSPSDIERGIGDEEAVRTFRYPAGRFWSVAVKTYTHDGAQPRLRFTAGGRSIDLASWPRDWSDYPDEGLIELLRYGAPPRGDAPAGQETPRRRWTDWQGNQERSAEA